jgi:4-oxalocrotonate tautomerase
MPWVQINLLEGRSLEKKHALHRKVTAAVAEALDIPESAIKVQLIDMPPENYSQAGMPQDTVKK